MEQKKVGPLTLIKNICDIKQSAARSTITAVGYVLSMLIVIFVLADFNKVVDRIGIVAGVMVSALFILNLISLRSEIKRLGDTALEAAKLYDEEISAREDDKFKHHLEKGRKPS